jgi:hypothetical protein
VKQQAQLSDGRELKCRFLHYCQECSA